MNSSPRCALALFAALILWGLLVLVSSALAGLTDLAWLQDFCRLFSSNSFRDGDVLASLVVPPFVLVVCAVALQWTLGKDFAQAHRYPVPLLSFVRLPVFIWVVVSWGMTFIVHGRTRSDALSAALFFLPIYLLAGAVASYGARAWIAAALAISVCCGFGILPTDLTFPLAYLAVPPVAGVVGHAYGRQIQKRELPQGRCRGCGYDLTGNISGTCPECGLPMEGECVEGAK